jgi:hypothetical protein
MNHPLTISGIQYSLVPSSKIVHRQPGYYIKADAFGENGNMIMKGVVIGPIEEKVAAACLHFLDSARISNAENWETLSALIGDIYGIPTDVYTLLKEKLLVLDESCPGKVKGEVFHCDQKGGCREMIRELQE